MDNSIKLWDTARGKLRRTLKGHTSSVQSVAFSADGKTLASGSWDATVKLWDATTGKPLRTLKRNSSIVQSIAFSSDGKTLAAGTWNSTATIWDTTTGKLLRTLQGSPSNFRSMAFGPNGKTLAAGLEDSSIRLWSTSTGEHLVSMYGFDTGDYVTHSPQGYFVASKDGDKFISWRINNKLFSFDRYAKTFHRPDTIAKILSLRTNQKSLSAPKLTEAPRLAWENLFIKTSDKQIELILRYEGASPFGQLVFFHNNNMINYEFNSKKTNSLQLRLKIPLTLNNRENHINVVAFDKNLYRSDPINKSFIFSVPGSKSFQVRFQNDIPPEFISSSRLTIDGETYQIKSIDQNDKSVRLLGKNKSLIKSGLKKIKNAGIDAWYFFEDNVLKPFDNPYKKSYAIIVAINDFQRKKYPQNSATRKKFPKGPTGYEDVDMISSAKQLIDVLQTLGFPRKNIFPLFDEKATAKEIDNHLEFFWEGGKYSDADRLFFYFGGHGDISGNSGYLITYDFDENRPTLTSFLMKDLTGRHFDNIKAKHMLVTLDSCYSGLSIPGFLTDPKRDKRKQTVAVIKQHTRNTARNVLVAAKGDQQALWKKNGAVFTQALIEGLKKSGDNDEDNIIQFLELVNHVSNKVIGVADDDMHQQTPVFHLGTKWGDGRILFIRPAFKN